MTSRPVPRFPRGLLLAAGLLAAPLALAPASTLAQTASSPPPAATPPASTPPASTPPASTPQATPPGATPVVAQPRMDKRTAAQVEARIARLHSELRITPGEQTRWDAFTAIMRQNAAHTDEVLAMRGDAQNASALEDMGNYTAMAVAHAQDMQKLLPAFEDLYNSMSPEQRKLTDSVFRQQEDRRHR